MNTNPKPAAGAFANERSRKIACPPSPSPVHEPAASAKKEAAAAEPKAMPPSKTRKAGRRPLRSSASNSEKLVCRYCGSDDLAPSFKKRRDARCRACFKKRYGSATRGKQAVRTRKTKAAK